MPDFVSMFNLLLMKEIHHENVTILRGKKLCGLKKTQQIHYFPLFDHLHTFPLVKAFWTSTFQYVATVGYIIRQSKWPNL